MTLLREIMEKIYEKTILLILRIPLSLPIRSKKSILDIKEKICYNIKKKESINKISEEENMSKEIKWVWEDFEKGGRFSLDWDEQEAGVTLIDKIKFYLEKNGNYKYKTLEIGYWEEAYEKDSEDIINFLAENQELFPNVNEIFIGNMEQEENEISWIIQADVSPLIKAFPLLEVLKVQGGNGLRFSPIASDKLKVLEIISGGTPVEPILDLQKCQFPNLIKLEIYLGVEDYGFDANIKDIRGLMSAKLYPSLKYLGIKNSEIQNEVFEAVLESDILLQLEVLDISYGTFDNKGAEVLLKNMEKLKHLNKINIEYNFITEEYIKKIIEAAEKYGIEIETSQDDVDLEWSDEEKDFEYKYPYITE